MHHLRFVRNLALSVAFVVSLSVWLACSRSTTKIPHASDPSVRVTATASSSLVKTGAPAPLIVRVAITTQRRSSARPPVNMALLVDTSGSMDGKAIADARAASLALLETLTKDDRICVVVFHSRAEVLLPSTRVGDADLVELKAKISAMKAEGTTDMGHGLELALSEVRRHFVRQGVNRIVMLGDGVPNDEGIVHHSTESARASGVSITTLGLGNDYDETLMGKIAQETGGKFQYVEDSARVASFFREEVVRLHQVVAKNTVVTLQPGPGVVVRQIIGRRSSAVGRSASVHLGDLSFGEQQELLVELEAAPTKDGSVVEALDITAHWDDEGQPNEAHAFVGARASSDAARVDASKNQDVLDAALRAKDAAVTLEQIEGERRRLNTQKIDDLPAPAPAVIMSPEQMRRVHADAIRNFQAN